MKAFYRFLFLFALVATIHMAEAQQAQQVIVANGGVFGPANTIRMGSFVIGTSTYSLFDSLPASSVQHVLIHGRDAILCADSFVVRYNLDNLQRAAIATVPGARQTAVYGSKVLISKGYGAVNGYFEVRNLSDLSLVQAVSGLGGECEGIVVAGDSAYVAVPLGFGAATGKIAVIDLQAQSLVREIDLDTNGRIIKNMYRSGTHVYSLNQINYGSSYGVISDYKLGTAADVTHFTVPQSTSMGTGIYNGLLYAQFGGGLAAWDINSGTLSGSTIVPGYWAAMAMDTLGQRFYVTETDYATYGRLHAYNWQGQRVDSAVIGVSPEAIAVDYGTSTGRTPLVTKQALRTWPQPFADGLYLDLGGLPHGPAHVQLYDLSGKQVAEAAFTAPSVAYWQLPALPAGAYSLQVSAKSGSFCQVVLKGQ